jgi:phage terminase Nu1 subunit (DNA packaging protein)
MARMSFAQYAKHRGVSKTAVSQAVKQGRITVKIDPVTAERYLDSERADVEWEKNSDQSKNVNGGANGRRRGKPKAAKIEHESQSKAPPLYESRAIKEAFLARKAKVEYERMIGKLVEAEQVEARWQKIIATAKTRLLAVSSKSRARIPHLTIEEVAIIDEEIRLALSEVSRSEIDE